MRPGSLLSPRPGKRSLLEDSGSILLQVLLVSVILLLAWMFTDSSVLHGFSPNVNDDVMPEGQSLIIGTIILLFLGMAVVCNYWPHLRIACGAVVAAVFLIRLIEVEIIRDTMKLGLPRYAQDQRLFYQCGVVASLAFIGWGLVPRLKALLSASHRPQPEAALAMARPRNEHEESFRHWIEILEEGSPSERAGAAQALGSVGPRARGALLPLVRALKDPDQGVRTAAADALGRIVTE